MSSAAKALANRQNSLHSTGPVTAAGKAASSQNAMRHGLTSKQIVLPGEDAAQYDELRQALACDLRPGQCCRSPARRRTRRGLMASAPARRQETLILQKLAGDNADCDAAFATAFIEKPKEIGRLTRYITSIERAYYRAMAKLEQMQKERIAEETKAAFELAAFEYRASSSRTGFVSQPQPVAMAAGANVPLPAQHMVAPPPL